MTPFYDADGITIFHGDCREIVPVLGPVDHVITDPPYSEQTHANHAARCGFAESIDNGPRAQLGFESTSADSLRALLAAVQGRRWAVFTLDHVLNAHLTLRPPEGWRYVRSGVWVKPSSMPQMSGDRPAMGHENVVILHRDMPGRMRWNGGGHRAIWTDRMVQGEHPTEKPLSLYRQFVEQFTDPGDLILDPFMGSGTTLRAAKDLGRRAIGIEREEKWCAVAVGRLRQGALLVPTLPVQQPLGIFA